MNDWNNIWNSFCDEVSKSVSKNNLEKVFEKGIAKDFFSVLGWNVLTKGMIEQYPVKFATVTHKADFALFVNSKNTPEIIIELKRPSKKKEEKDANQLIDYMRQESCSYGILLLGEKLEIYYIDYSTPKHEASLVETIKYKRNNEAAFQLMEVLNRNEYTPAKMLEYCHKRVKINKTVEYWCSEDGKTEIMDMIVERSKLPEHLLETLRTTLVVDVRRIDGLNTVSSQTVNKVVKMQATSILTVSTKGQKRPPMVWMVPASTKFFNHEACFEEQGYIYWKQYNSMQPGDTGYIYLSAPQKCIRYKFVIDACDLPYSKEMEVELKYHADLKEFESAKTHNRFYRIRKIGESTSDRLSIKDLMQNGLKKAPQGTLKLSQEKYSELLAYIESNF